MIELKLTQNKTSLIDDDDWELVSKYKWHALCKEGRWYARTKLRINGKWIGLEMQKLIMGVPIGSPRNDLVDHRDGDGLNNRKENLRRCTKSQNMMNRGRQANNKTGFKGVFWDKREQRFAAKICTDKKTVFLGQFKDVEQAACAYNIAALKHHGEFSYQNRI